MSAPRFEHRRVVLENTGEHLVEEHHAEALNPKRMAEELFAGGLQLAPIQPERYGDASGPRTLQQAIELVAERQEWFEMHVPARARQAAQNDVVVFEEMLLDEQGRQHLVDHGFEIEGYQRTQDAPAEVVTADAPPEAATVEPSEPVVGS